MRPRPRRRGADRGLGVGLRRWPPPGEAAERSIGPAAFALTVVPPAPVAEERRSHRDPSNFPIDLPEPGEGVDRFRVRLPAGTRFALADIEPTELSPLAELTLETTPTRGAEGEVEIAVRWTHAPYGRIAYVLRVYANPDGEAPRVTVVEGSTGFAQRTRALLAQDARIAVEVRGARADGLRTALEQATAGGAAPTRASELVTISVIAGLAIVALGAVLMAMGLFIFYALVQEAMRRQYDIEDTGFRGGVGEGASRTEQAMVFNLKRKT